MFENLITKVKHFKHIPHAIRRGQHGLKKLPKDDRDFTTEKLGWFGYTPKHDRKVNKTLSVKDQERLNTCQWNATDIQKEPDEGVLLSVRSLVNAGRQMGLVGSLGLSNLRSGQMVLKDFGILSEKTCADTNKNDWSIYNGFPVNNYADEANKRKIASFWRVSGIDDIYKLLDDGKIIVTGMKWYSGYNQSGGFKSPWIIDGVNGWYVGGHAFAIIGYDRDYNGKDVIICQNSYGADWGDNGKFYIEVGFCAKNTVNMFGAYANLDIVPDIGKFLTEYTGKNVKGSASTIYRIEGSKKRAYPNELIYFAHNTDIIKTKANMFKDTFNDVDDDVLNKVEKGEDMKLDEGSQNVKDMVNYFHNKLNK